MMGISAVVEHGRKHRKAILLVVASMLVVVMKMLVTAARMLFIKVRSAGRFSPQCWALNPAVLGVLINRLSGVLNRHGGATCGIYNFLNGLNKGAKIT